MKLYYFTIIFIATNLLSCQAPSNHTEAIPTQSQERESKVKIENGLIDTTTFIVSTLQHTNGVEIPTNPKHNFFVINYKGARIYAQPDFKAAIIDTFYCGKGIQKKYLTTLQKDRYEVHPDLILEGDWLKMLKPIEGYIFSTDFSEIRPRVTHYLVNMIELLGSQTKETIQKDTTIILKDKSYTFPMEITSYQNGVYKYIELDGCFDHIYNYHHLAFHEVYHQMMSCYLGAYGNDNHVKVDVPTFLEKKNGEYLFKGSDATIEVILRQNSKGYWETYSYDCT